MVEFGSIRYSFSRSIEDADRNTFIHIANRDLWIAPVENRMTEDLARVHPRDLYDEYWRFQFHQPRYIGCQILQGVYVIGGWGAVIQPQTSTLFTCHSYYGWQKSHVDYFLNRNATGVTESEFFISDSYWSEPDRTVSSAALIAFPGINTYGHWLIDVVARMKTMELCEVDPPENLIVGQSLTWQQPLAEALGIGNHSLVPALGGVYVEELILPTMLRCCDFLSTNAYQSLIQPGSKPPKDSILFIRHTPMTSSSHRNSAQDIKAVEKLVASMGGIVCDPVRIPIKELQSILCKFSVVIGEDSSALHNIILSEANNCLLVVLSKKRRNLLHAGIQSLRQSPIHYIFPDATRDEYNLREIVTVIENHLKNCNQSGEVPSKKGKKMRQEFTCYRDPNRKVGSQREIPSLTRATEAWSINGYQKFKVQPGGVDLTLLPHKFKKVFSCFESLTQQTQTSNQSILDIGCSSGLSSLIAHRAGFKKINGIDHDPEYIAILNAIAENFSLPIRAETSDWMNIKESSDVVCMFALIHWIYSMTSNQGSFWKIFERIREITGNYFLVEWVDPKDPAIGDAKHILRNVELHEQTYCLSNFTAALEAVIGDVEGYIETSPTRVIYIVRKMPRNFGYSAAVSRKGPVVRKWFRPNVLRNQASLIDREKKSLAILSGLQVSPEIIAMSAAHIDLTYAGEPLSAKNAPSDICDQAERILAILSTKGIKHNDIHCGNLFVLGGNLRLIDFGWATFGGEPTDFLPRNIGVDMGVREKSDPIDDRAMMLASVNQILDSSP